MKQLFQTRLQQHLRGQTSHNPVSAPAKRQIRPISHPPVFLHSGQALLIVDANRKLHTINSAASQLLCVAAEDAQGQPIDILADGVLSAVALRPNALQSTTVFELADGRVFQAKTRLLPDNRGGFLGWMVVLQPVDTEDAAELDTGTYNHSVTHALQDQIQTMQEFIGMLPQFSQNQYWRHLLVEHMEKLAHETHTQVQRLALPATEQPPRSLSA